MVFCVAWATPVIEASCQTYTCQYSFWVGQRAAELKARAAVDADPSDQDAWQRLIDRLRSRPWLEENIAGYERQYAWESREALEPGYRERAAAELDWWGDLWLETRSLSGAAWCARIQHPMTEARRASVAAAVEAMPDDATLAACWARALVHEGRFALAIAHLEAYRGRHPERLDAHDQLTSAIEQLLLRADQDAEKLASWFARHRSDPRITEKQWRWKIEHVEAADRDLVEVGGMLALEGKFYDETRTAVARFPEALELQSRYLRALERLGRRSEIADHLAGLQPTSWSSFDWSSVCGSLPSREGPASREACNGQAATNLAVFGTAEDQQDERAYEEGRSFSASVAAGDWTEVLAQLGRSPRNELLGRWREGASDAPDVVCAAVEERWRSGALPDAWIPDRAPLVPSEDAKTLRASRASGTVLVARVLQGCGLEEAAEAMVMPVLADLTEHHLGSSSRDFPTLVQRELRRRLETESTEGWRRAMLWRTLARTVEDEGIEARLAVLRAWAADLPEEVKPWREARRLLAEAGRQGEALEAYAAVASRSTDDPDEWVAYGAAALRWGNHQRVREIASSVLRSPAGNNRHRMEASYLVGRVDLREGRIREALPSLEEYFLERIRHEGCCRAPACDGGFLTFLASLGEDRHALEHYLLRRSDAVEAFRTFEATARDLGVSLGCRDRTALELRPNRWLATVSREPDALFDDDGLLALAAQLEHVR